MARYDSLTSTQLEAYRDAINTYLTTGLFPGGAQGYAIEGRTITALSLKDAMAVQSDIMSALERKSQNDGLGIALVEFGDPR